MRLQLMAFLFESRPHWLAPKCALTAAAQGKHPFSSQ
jgi:hypothetical protein